MWWKEVRVFLGWGIASPFTLASSAVGMVVPRPRGSEGRAEAESGLARITWSDVEAPKVILSESDAEGLPFVFKPGSVGGRGIFSEYISIRMLESPTVAKG